MQKKVQVLIFSNEYLFQIYFPPLMTKGRQLIMLFSEKRRNKKLFDLLLFSSVCLTATRDAQAHRSALDFPALKKLNLNLNRTSFPRKIVLGTAYSRNACKSIFRRQNHIFKIVQQTKTFPLTKQKHVFYDELLAFQLFFES